VRTGVVFIIQRGLSPSGGTLRELVDRFMLSLASFRLLLVGTEGFGAISNGQVATIKARVCS